MKILFKNGTLVDPRNHRNGCFDVLVEDGIVAAVEAQISCQVDQVYDLTGKVLVPGFVDMHVHLREPGFEYKEDIESGTKAAVKGGVTTVACMPNTKPAISTMEVVEYIQNKTAEKGVCKVEIVGSISKGLVGDELSDMEDMLKAGIVAVSDDGRTTMDVTLMTQAFEIIKPYDGVLISHAEDHTLTVGASIHEGEVSAGLGLKGIPSAAEYLIVERDIALCEAADSRLHIAHISTVESLEAVRAAKKKGLSVTCEVGPHHFILTDDWIKSVQDTEFKVNPPLRSKVDVEAMLSGILDGSIDAIATDHAPHSVEDKNKHINDAAFGISGIETSFALCYTYLVKSGLITFERLIDMMTAKPAEILRLAVGGLGIGDAADMAILDIKKDWVIDPEAFVSKGKNSPFNGFEVTGNVDMTFVNGKLVYGEGVLLC
jgi:dihydroorotase